MTNQLSNLMNRLTIRPCYYCQKGFFFSVKDFPWHKNSKSGKLRECEVAPQAGRV